MRFSSVIKTFLIFPVVGFVISCKSAKLSKGQKETEQATESIPAVDTSMIAILPDKFATFVFEEPQATTLSLEELVEIERLVKKHLEPYNTQKAKEFEKHNAQYPDLGEKREYFVIEWERYKKQYIPVINKNGDKEVWVNCLCESFDSKHNWREEIIMVLDGGNCYFNLEVNLTRQTCSELKVNGSG